MPTFPSARFAHASSRSHESRWDGPGALAALAVGLAAFVFYGAVSLVLYANFRSGMDLAIFDQAVRGLSHFHAPISSMKSPGMNLWGDHFHPILVLAAPFYWIWDDPRMLLLVQALAIGMTAAIVVTAARRLYFRTSVLPPTALGLAFATSLGVAYGAMFDFHEVALGMPLLALALASLLARKDRWFLAWCFLTLLVKEDAGVIVFGVGMAAFARGRRALGAVVMTVSTVWTVVAVKVIIPALSPTGTWLYANSVTGVSGAVWSAFRSLVTDGGLTKAVLWLLLAYLGLSVRSWLLIGLLPNLATRAVSFNVNYWRIYNHYNFLPSVIVAFAAIEVLGTKVTRVRLVSALLMVVAIASWAFGPALSQGYHAVVDSRAAGARQILSYIPPGVPVAADAYITPHLTKTHPITQQVRPATPTGIPAYTDDLGHPLVADYLVFDSKTTSNMADGSWTRAAIEYFATHGFHITHQVGEYTLMQRN